MPDSPPNRRPVDFSSLEAHAAKVKLRGATILPDKGKKGVRLSREALVPIIQAEVGSEVSLLVHRYRLLVPVAQLIHEKSKQFAGSRLRR